MSLVVAVLGWLGAASLLVAYGLTSTGRLPPEGGRFQSLNLLGAGALTVNSAYHGAWPSAALNVVWIVIGVAAVIRARRLHPPRTGNAESMSLGGTPPRIPQRP